MRTLQILRRRFLIDGQRLVKAREIDKLPAVLRHQHILQTVRHYYAILNGTCAWLWLRRQT